MLVIYIWFSGIWFSKDRMCSICIRTKIIICITVSDRPAKRWLEGATTIILCNIRLQWPCKIGCTLSTRNVGTYVRYFYLTVLYCGSWSGSASEYIILEGSYLRSMNEWMDEWMDEWITCLCTHMYIMCVSSFNEKPVRPYAYVIMPYVGVCWDHIIGKME